jgi:hypothetical protein
MRSLVTFARLRPAFVTTEARGMRSLVTFARLGPAFVTTEAPREAR